MTAITQPNPLLQAHAELDEEALSAWNSTCQGRGAEAQLADNQDYFMAAFRINRLFKTEMGIGEKPLIPQEGSVNSPKVADLAEAYKGLFEKVPTPYRANYACSMSAAISSLAMQKGHHSNQGGGCVENSGNSGIPDIGRA